MKKQGLCSEIWRKKENYLYMLPFFAIFTVFTVLPVIISMALSFTYYNVFNMPQFVGLANYYKLFFNDDIFRKAVLNTVVIAIAVGPIGYVLSFILAWMINDLSRGLRSVLVLFFYAPSISGNLYVIWKIIFSDDANGLVNSLLIYTGLSDTNIYWLTDKKYMLGIIILVSLWMSMGTGFLSFVAGLQGVDGSLLEAGSIDGIRNRWQELWYVILPSMKPQLMFGAVMSITQAFSVGDITEQLCGFPSTDYAVHTVANHMKDYGLMRFEMGYASAIATLLFLAMVLSNKLFQHVLKKI